MVLAAEFLVDVVAHGGSVNDSRGGIGSSKGKARQDKKDNE